jgi:glycosyltransferase involved in cell wall biosynthesis
MRHRPDGRGADAGPFLSLAILCYRSQERIVPFVEKMHDILSDYNFKWELILVANYQDGVHDRTPEIVAELCKRLPNTTAVAMKKKGMMGWDMVMGLDACRGEYIGVVDGDGQFPHEAINACIGRLLHDEVDLVKTYRVLRGDGPVRIVLSFGYNTLFRLLFRKSRYLDINSKPKFFRRSVYEQLHIESTDWFADAEIMIKAGRLGLRVAEIPVHYQELEGRYSFVKPEAVLEFLKNLWRYRFGEKRAR